MTTTIAAIATAPGRGGVGIIRISGPLAKTITKTCLGTVPKTRYAHYGPFHSHEGDVLDHGIALFFQAPNSFTGEDVLELQGHGGPIVLDMLLESMVAMGAQLAKPGEFSERAFLNDKMDLTQAEAIADLIDASSRQAAKQALNALEGDFSKCIDQLLESLIHLRLYVESAIDFPDEEIDFLSDGVVEQKIKSVLSQFEDVLKQAEQGVLCREGMRVVITGRPNAGKSSLLNCLAQKDIAIVTDVAGTTRDVIREYLNIDGMPLHLVDTAGIRDNADTVEQIGIERAQDEIARADRVLLMVDATDPNQHDIATLWPNLLTDTSREKLTVILNKVDLKENLILDVPKDLSLVRLSAKQRYGIDTLKSHLKKVMGYNSTLEGGFSARRRHVDALNQANQHVQQALMQLQGIAAGELIAEDLRLAQDQLGEITGRFTADDLLGRIFSSFCIGK